MSQFSMLDGEAIDDRYLISGKTAIRFTLTGYAKTRERFMVHCRDLADSFLTTLLAVDLEGEQLIFDYSGSAELNRRFAAADGATLVGQPGGITVQFEVGAAKTVNFEGAPAFAVDLPQRLYRMQRREYFRVETPRVRSLIFRGTLPDGRPLTLPVHDISLSGLGLTADIHPDDLEPGQLIEHCHLALPGDPREMIFAVNVRRLDELKTPTGHRYWRIGVQFRQLPASDETRIQRYIAHLERERHELL